MLTVFHTGHCEHLFLNMRLRKILSLIHSLMDAPNLQSGYTYQWYFNLQNYKLFLNWQIKFNICI